MNIELEIVLLKSLCLKANQKSLRRFRLAAQKLIPIKIERPTSRCLRMLEMPETTLVGGRTNNPIFLHRFAQMISEEDPPAAFFLDKISYDISPAKSGRSSRLVSRVVTCQDGGLEQKRWTSFNLDPSKLIPKSRFQIEYVPRSLYRLRTEDHRLEFVKVGPALVPALSRNPRGVLQASLCSVLYDTKSPSEHIFDRLLDQVVLTLRYFQLELDFVSQGVYTSSIRGSGGERRDLEKWLLEFRIDVLEAVIEFFQGPLAAVITEVDLKHSGFDELCNLPDKLANMKTLLATIEANNCPLAFEQIYHWDICRIVDTEISTWEDLIVAATESQQREFIRKSRTYVERYCVEIERDSKMTFQELIEQGVELKNRVMDFDNFFGVKGSDQDCEPCWHCSTYKANHWVKVESEMKPKLLEASRKYLTDPFLLPSRLRADKSNLWIVRGDCVLKGKTESTGWSYELITARDPGNTRLQPYFTLTEEGNWSHRGTIEWPPEQAAQEGLTPAWDCLLAEFTANQVFLLCSQPARLVLMCFDLYRNEDSQNRIIYDLQPYYELSESDFVEGVRIFYQGYHDPYRSDTLKWVESEGNLLWAVHVHGDYEALKSQEETGCLLLAFTLDRHQLKVQAKYEESPQEEWVTTAPDWEFKSRLDPRRNMNLGFYFTWRRVSSRILGVWLRARGGYHIYEKLPHRFCLCCKRENGSFEDYFMTEQLPCVPGWVRELPIILRRNNTVKLLTDCVAFEMLELKIRFN